MGDFDIVNICVLIFSHSPIEMGADLESIAIIAAVIFILNIMRLLRSRDYKHNDIIRSVMAIRAMKWNRPILSAIGG